MKVWVLQEWSGSEDTGHDKYVIGVYDSEQAAKDAMARCENRFDCDISEHEVRIGRPSICTDSAPEALR